MALMTVDDRSPSSKAPIMLTDLLSHHLHKEEPVKISVTEKDLDGSGSEAELEEDVLSQEDKLSNSRRKHKQIFERYIAENAVTEEPSERSDTSPVAGRFKSRLRPKTRSEEVRPYQQELYERASVGNVIAVLPTGAGKTLIATKLLKDACQAELLRRDKGEARKTAFFLVDKTFLAKQQANYLRSSLLGENIGCCTGEDWTDLWSKERWTEIITTYNIIVCTAEVLNQCLGHGYIKMEQISLLVFDEAHHTKKDHPYARIIKDYYITLQDLALRPRIFSMTASPIDAKADVVEAAQALETLLHSKIATSTDPSLIDHCPRPVEVEWIYEKLQFPFETDLCRQLALECNSFTLRKNMKFAKMATSQLGPKCADMVWNYKLDDAVWEGRDPGVHRRWLPDYRSKEDGTWDDEEKKLEHAQDIILAYSLRTRDMTTQGLSSKVRLLHEKLEEFFNARKETRCIVFVEQRATALILCDLFREFNVNGLHPGAFVGNGGGNLSGGRTSTTKQEEILAAFEEGRINCLFATSVAEEGLDIQECNLVIRFDLCMTMIQYLQSRGRARKADSIFVHMVEAGNGNHRDLVNDAREAEAVLLDFCNTLPEDRIMHGCDADIEELVARDRLGQAAFQIAASGARLTPRSSLAILENYATSLRYMNPESTARVTYTPQHLGGGSFQYMALLPEESAFRGALGDARSRKIHAKQSAAFHTCVKLYKLGHLDETFNSTIRQRRPLMANAKLAIKGAKKELYDRQVKPKFWDAHVGSSPHEVYGTVITFRPSTPLQRSLDSFILLTRAPIKKLPAFHVYLEGDNKVSVETTPLPLPLALDNANGILDLLTAFTLQLFDDLFNKKYKVDETALPYWQAPIKQNIVIEPQKCLITEILDIALLQQVKSNPRKYWVPGSLAEDWHDKFLVDPWAGSRRYFSENTFPGLNVHSPLPWPLPTRRFKNTVMDYTLSLFSGSRARFWENVDVEQPVLKAKLVPLKRNLFDAMNEKEITAMNRDYVVCPQALELSVLPVSTVCSFLVFPTIISRIDSYLVALEACEALGLSIGPELALEALTKDSDNTEEHREEQIHLQRGMGKNYERLEFIGDTFLKMSTSISLFIRYPSESEYDFHVSRMEMICNQNLFDGAVMDTRNLPQFIRTEAFNRRTWYPEGLILVQGKGAHAEEPLRHGLAKHPLGQKTIADVCEALIGAAYLTARETDGMDLAVKAVTLLINSTNHQAQAWREWSQFYELPKYQVAEVQMLDTKLRDFVSRELGYHFRYPRLLQSAFTHPSNPWASVPNYQRLEFLGDSLYDMVCVEYLFRTHPDKDPQWLTEHKMAMVSNKFLAALAVQLGFDTQLQSNSIALHEQILRYGGEVRRLLKVPKPKLSRDYWVNLDHPPKAISDMVEAYIGAIFIDSDFNFAVVEQFFEKHVRWYFKDMTIYDTFANKHPTTFLHNTLTDQYGCIDYRVMAQLAPGDVTERTRALVIVHEEVVADATASSGRVARIRASEKALRTLNGVPLEEFRVKYKCDCHTTRKHGDVPIQADSAI